MHLDVSVGGHQRFTLVAEDSTVTAVDVTYTALRVLAALGVLALWPDPAPITEPALDESDFFIALDELADSGFIVPAGDGHTLVVGTVGTAYVRGLQSTGIHATLKHLVGYSASRAGRNHAPVSIGPRELRDVVLVAMVSFFRYRRWL